MAGNLLASIFMFGLLYVSTLQEEGEPCFSNPCQNGGTCRVASKGRTFVCACVFGFHGVTCEKKSKCTFKHVIEGMKNTDHIDIIKLTGLNATAVQNCKDNCQETPGCRAIEITDAQVCSTFRIVPISIANVREMTSERGRLFALRRCFRPKVSTTTTDDEGVDDEPKKEL